MLSSTNDLGGCAVCLANHKGGLRITVFIFIDDGEIAKLADEKCSKTEEALKRCFEHKNIWCFRSCAPTLCMCTVASK